MTRILIYLNLVFLCSLLAAQTIEGKVVYVSDGDTFHVLIANGDRLKVRLAEVDCPEKDQPYGLEAKEYVLNLIKNEIVTLNVTSTDKYGRKIASLRIDGKDLAIDVVSKGMLYQKDTLGIINNTQIQRYLQNMN